MTERYKQMMAGEELSCRARERFYAGLRPRRRMPVRVAVLAACICLMVPATVLAADRLFGLGIVEIIEGRTEGYRTSYNDLHSRPIGDFSEELRHADDISHQAFGSWEEAEEAIGFDLTDNPFFSENGTYPVRTFNTGWAGEGRGSRLHCYADYYGLDGQLYRASVTAAYGREMTRITVRATVTAEHPAIPKEDETVFHSSGTLYDSRYITEITEETYTAKSGLTATVVRIVRDNVVRDSVSAPDYEAVFAADGISWQVSVSGYPATPEGEEKAKAMLLDILEGF